LIRKLGEFLEEFGRKIGGKYVFWQFYAREIEFLANKKLHKLLNIFVFS
jgi:hypothetical protein